MTTLSTHDTKRSEDVRARLLAVAGDAESWQRCSEAFARRGRARATSTRPPRTWSGRRSPASATIDDERLHGATSPRRCASPSSAPRGSTPTRSTKPGSSTSAADANGPGRLGALVRTAVDHNAEAVRALVLGQKLLAADPARRARHLPGLRARRPLAGRPRQPPARSTTTTAGRGSRTCATEPPRDLDDEKLLVTHRALALRRELRDCFGDLGDYQPLVGTSRHLVGFVRGGEVAVLATRAPQAARGRRRLGRRDVRAARGAVARRADRRAARRRRQPAAPTCFADYPVALLRRVHLRVTPRDLGAARRHRRPGHSPTPAHPLRPAADDGWWRADVDARRRRPLRASRSTAATPAPTRAGSGCPTARTARRRVVDTVAFAWTDDDWRGLDARRAR